MEEKNRALIIVDVQPTFTEGGALGVDGGNAVAERIADFVTENAEEYAFIVSTQDWHIQPGDHFSADPDYVDTWPAHGVAGTAEAELHEAIASLPLDDSVKKGQYSAAYSGFEGVNESGDSLEYLLRAHDIDAVDVVGIAESHCVMHTALDAVKAGWPVRVLSDLTVPVTEELGIEARKTMDEAGVDQLPSSLAFGFYDEGEDTPLPDEWDADPWHSSSSFADGAESDGEGEESGDTFGLFSSEGDFDEPAGYEPEEGFGAGEDFAQADDPDSSFAPNPPRGGEYPLDEDLSDLDLSEFGIDDLGDFEDVDFSADSQESDFDFSNIDEPGINGLR